MTIRLFGHYISRNYLVLGALEFLVNLMALVVGILLRLGFTSEAVETAWGAVDSIALIYAVLMTFAMISVGLYQRGLPLSAGLLVRLAISFLLASMAMSLVFFAFPDLTLGRGAVGVAMLVSLTGILCVRVVFLRVVGRESQRERVLVLGAGTNAARINQAETPTSNFRVVGYVAMPGEQVQVPDGLLREPPKRLLDLVEELQIDELVIAPDDRRQGLPLDEILDCKMSGVSVLDLLSFLEKEFSLIDIDQLSPGWLISSPGFQFGMATCTSKRVMDLVFGSVLLVVFSPLMVLVALAVWIEGRGRHPIFYHQTRVGMDGRNFRVHKFRSMRPDAEADGRARWATRNDNRVTSVGKVIRRSRLDELPQLFNVLRGDMSMVGPRPERPEFVDQLAGEIPYYRERHRVKPGVTGWAQLCYQYGSTTEDAKHKLQYDLYYVKNASPFLDLVVMLETLEVVLWGKGAH